MHVRKLARLDLEAIIPITAPQALQQIAGRRELTGFPLFENMAILVQHEPRIVEEVGPAPTQVDAPTAGRRHGAYVQAREQRMLEDLHVIEALAEGLLETTGDASG